MGLAVTNLSKHFKDQLALDTVNLSINENEIVGLLGPNGAGKSTLMKTIAGVLNIEKGQVTLNHHSVEDNSIDTKRNIGYLPEDNPLYAHMYVKEYLNFVAQLRKVPSSKVEEVIGLVGLTPEQSKKIGQLSKGYKQRVGLAQAIIHQPDLLILDEPTNGLDPNQIIEIREVIKKVGRGKMVLLSTHIMQEVEALCSRVVLIHKGQILQDAPIEAFKNKFSSLEEAFAAYTAKASV
ncbi:ABC transporter ATP-binding protein [Riemerella columbina]|uniref:ABC transporter ATP-binding protein n=1 Tax=Riemerella columbina TaxID=103810 RepID=UPI0003609D3A|nr:ATP-binding cassette domain-containing protein [Riemerella columbina]